MERAAWACYPYGPPAHITASTVLAGTRIQDQVGRKQTGKAQLTKIYEGRGSPGKKQRWQLLTDAHGVRV